MLNPKTGRAAPYSATRAWTGGGIPGYLYDPFTGEWNDRHGRAPGDAGTAVPFQCPFCGESYYFRPGLTWNKLGSSRFTARYSPGGFIFDDTSRSSFPSDPADCLHLLSIVNSKVGSEILTALNPTMSFTNWDLERVPITEARRSEQELKETINLYHRDWDFFEYSWNFQQLPLLLG